MRYPPEHKAETRRRILSEATEAFRAEGIDTLGIGKLMRRVGMTHGGFYKHFESKDALAGEACSAALADSGDELLAWAEGGTAALIEAYLSPEHRDDRTSGCTAAALAGELGRQAPQVRAAFQERLGWLVGDLAGTLESDPEDATFLLASLIGALTLSRAVAHRKVSERILEACRERLLAWSAAGKSESGAVRRAA